MKKGFNILGTLLAAQYSLKTPMDIMLRPDGAVVLNYEKGGTFLLEYENLDEAKSKLDTQSYHFELIE